MMVKPVVIGTFAYTVVTFPYAVIWQLVLFRDIYEEFGYFKGEPVVILGFASIIIQGVILSFLYPYSPFKGGSIAHGVKFSLTMGAFLAKNIVENPFSFLVMESFYLTLQFVTCGVLVGLIYSRVEGTS